jgi:2,4-dichlorophenol 6-monooxygenase
MPQAADYYRSKVVPEAFLLGDAAHAFPPTGGLGLNTGIADTHNLAWKIHAVEAGWSSTAILDTYNRERRPVAVVNGHQSQINLRNLHELLARTFAPEATDEQLVNDLHFHERLNNAIERNRDHFDSINLQIGYVYGEVSPETLQCTPYIPRCVPGARLPHMWIQRNSLRCSSLDLVDGASFVLLTSQTFPRTELTLEEIKTSTSIPLTTFRFGEDFIAKQAEWSEKMAFHHNDVKAILIRPDQHIVGIAERLSEIHLMILTFLTS